jgi:hypothetical protein
MPDTAGHDARQDAPVIGVRRRAGADLQGSMRLALCYMAFGHACFIAALAMLAWHPGRWPYVYHPQLIAIVHLVTLGWITGSIVGMFYLVGPIALRLPLPATRWDAAACAAFMVGVLGIVASAWRLEYAGMAAAAPCVLAAVARLGWRVMRGLQPGDIAYGVRLHVVLAFANFLLAGGLGAAMGIDRQWHFWPATPVAQTWAHAHLAVIGWGVMMVVGLSYRLIPMMVPAAMPYHASLSRSAWLLQLGTLGIVIGHLGRWFWLLPVAGLVVAAGVRAFVVEIRGIVQHRLPPPATRPPRDRTIWISHAAAISLVIAVALGLVLTVLPASRVAQALAWIYGVAAIIGYLAQIVIGMGGRLFPMLAWYAAMADRGCPPACYVHELTVEPLVRVICVTWLAGVPALALGLALHVPLLVSAACVALLIGVASNGAHLALMLRRARRAAR